MVDAANRFRARRADELLRRFPDLRSMRVIDLGGSLTFWENFASQERPRDLTIMNLGPVRANLSTPTLIQGDACSADTMFEPEAFDLVVSNSVLEHVGGHHRRQQFANAVEHLATRHRIQTPNLYFPLEPHWLFPGMQFLPFDARVAVARHWHFGHVRAQSHKEAVEEVSACELISRSQLRALFPTSEIWTERVFSLSKSLVAIRT